jgi:transcriptional regulator with XRE-family HTH domain
MPSGVAKPATRRAPLQQTRARPLKAKAVPLVEPVRVGIRIKGMRRFRNMTLQQLAKLARCSVSILSKIENGKATPSFAMLHNILSALDTNLSAFFAEAESEEKVVVRQQERQRIDLKEFQRRGRKVSIEQFIPHARGRMLQGNLITVQTGGKSAGQYSHRGEEAGFLIEGFLELTIGRRVYHLGPGDSFCFRSEISHSFRNPGPGQTKILWVNTPPTF